MRASALTSLMNVVHINVLYTVRMMCAEGCGAAGPLWLEL